MHTRNGDGFFLVSRIWNVWVAIQLSYIYVATRIGGGGASGIH